MRYVIQRLDGRYSYRDWFEYYLGFSNHMSNRQGPEHYNNALKWFMETYGWSAEIRQYHKIMQWNGSMVINQLINRPGATMTRSQHCNPNWSWTNSFGDLRIYVATDQELAFFQLAHPVDQKT